ncbi:hypothetical protein CEP49_06755 [Mergibacter septicus]|uniref:gp436 family protein n=1 Tax=Mergibacter septicus TaxID=221402 RepID=UPI0011791BF3|nr:phage protein Gp36 family protein [Mergibacter septicus]AWX14270.1 hypothetical protein CEP49_06755 [Mergibacter septicus]
MAYATVEQFLLRIGNQQAIDLTDRDMTGEVNQDVLNAALTDSSSQIDFYLSGRYKLPLETVPDNLVRICCDLARYRLCSMSNTTITDEVIARYKQTLSELESIASGSMSIGIENTDDTTSDSENILFFNSAKRVFSRD